MGSMIGLGDPSLEGQPIENRSPQWIFLHFAAEISQGCPGERMNALSITVPHTLIRNSEGGG